MMMNFGLLFELIKRDFVGRYKGSLIGVFWAIVNPLLMLAIYTLVFSVAFKAKWGVANESHIGFAIVLYSGMIVHTLFSEVISRAPSLVTSYPNYVKKVIFPLEILPLMVLGGAIINFSIGLITLFLFCFFTGTHLLLSSLLIPIILIPLLLMTLGFSWILSSLGVYLRDLSHGIGMVSIITLFLAPVFYPINAMPEEYRALIYFNPVTFPIQQIRQAMFFGSDLDWLLWGWTLLIGIVLSCLGYWWFQITRKGFSDVL
jgi:lipopolysaccharide transport system permease protein